MTTAHFPPRLAAMVALAASWGASCADAAGSGDGLLRVALDEAGCAEFCVDTVEAAVFRAEETIPLRPTELVSCGDEIRFERLPAGHRVRVELTLSHAGKTVATGKSPVVTVVADDTVDVQVDLEPAIVPAIETVAPDPVVVIGEDAPLVITGSGFGSGGGLSQVELDGTPLTAQSWSDTEVLVNLGEGAAGTGLRVRACGVASDAWPIRVLGGAVAAESYCPAGCPSLTLVDAAFDTRTHALALVARVTGGAEGNEGLLYRFLADDCVFAPETTALPHAPVALALDGAGAAWIASEDDGGLLRVALPGDAPSPAGGLGDGLPLAVAASGADVFVIVREPDDATRLLHFDEESPDEAEVVEGLEGAIELIGLAADEEGVVALGRSDEGVARLVRVHAETDMVPTTWPLPDCLEPTGLATHPSRPWVAVGCAGDGLLAPAGISLFDRGESPPIHVPDEALMGATALAFDDVGDLVLTWAPATGLMSALQVPSGELTGAWHLPPAPLSGPGLIPLRGSQRLAVGGPLPGEFRLLATFAGTKLCPGLP